MEASKRSRRSGKFFVSRLLLDEILKDQGNKELIDGLFGGMVVIRAEYLYDGILYEAFNEKFRELKESEFVPRYTPVVNRKEVTDRDGEVKTEYSVIFENNCI